MDREYMDEGLRRLATDSGFRPKGWSDQEISDFLVLVQCARAARLDTDLRNSRMLRIEPDGSGDPNRAQTTLSTGRVINLTFKSTESHGSVVFEPSTPEMESPR